jgi:hypothetical protein
VTRPNLADPQERAAYRRELRGIHRVWQLLGLALLGGGLALALFGRRGFDAISLTLIAAGWIIAIGVIAGRTRYFVDCVAERRSPESNGRDGLVVTAMIEAVLKSLAERRPVRMDEVL